MRSSTDARSEPCDRECMTLKYPLGSRVLLRQIHGGMVAQVSENSLLIALDTMEWVDVPFKLAWIELSPVALDGPGVIKTKPRLKQKVVRINYERDTPVGMFLGSESEMIFGGEANAYYVHIARPIRNGRHTYYKERSFASGDLLEHNTTKQRASVARVVYRAKSTDADGKALQMRKLLVLINTDVIVKMIHEQKEPSPERIKEMALKSIFTGSWLSWRRVPAMKSGAAGWGERSEHAVDADCLRVDIRNMPLHEQVCVATS